MNEAATTAVVRLFGAIDGRDFDTVRRLLADDVTLDYVSVFGGEVETIPADEVVARWRALLPGFDATQHLLGLLAEIDGAVQGNVRGYHRLDEETWMVAGWYRIELEAGDPPRVAGIALSETYETGSRDLVTRAQERAGR